jgi:hypothetical protein
MTPNFTVNSTPAYNQIFRFSQDEFKKSKSARVPIALSKTPQSERNRGGGGKGREKREKLKNRETVSFLERK